VLGVAGTRLVAAERAQSLIVFGPTQSHKTSGLAVPAILEWSGPVVASSVKTDLMGHTAAHRATVGTVQCFDPSGATGLESAGWSPLPASATWPGARRAASGLTEVARSSVGTMSDGDFWYATAARLLAPLLFAAAFGRRNMDDVIRWVETQEEAEVLDLLAASGVVEADQAARSAFGKEERQRSSIYTTVETILEPFAGTAGGSSTGSGEGAVDPRRLVSGSNTLYLCAPAHDQRRLTPLFVSVIRQILEHVYDTVTLTGRPLDPPLLLVLDEAANIAPLPDLDALASTAAGHGVQLVTVWHDLSQISARFGPRATTVVNNHRAKLFLSGISDPATLDHASRLIGDEERLLPATTRGGSGGPSTTHSPALRPLAPGDALRRIPAGSGVLVYGDLPPVRLRLRTWFDDPWLRSRAGPSAG
jgi:type IV secretion system protein VirD4